MKKRLALLCAVATCLLVVAPTAAVASSGTQTFDLEMEAPNVAQAPNGDMVAVTGHGEFSVHPKSVEASGDFTHTDSEGNVIAAGTWEATQLLSYQSYGCGVVFGIPLPPNFCGGKLMMRVLLSTPLGQFKGTMWVFCVIGPNPPNFVEEGIRLSVPGIINFNDVVTGENVYIRTS
jgi:hypothetical protein